MLTIKYEGKAVQSALGELLRSISRPEPLLRRIGQDLAESTMQRFAGGKAPDGTPWAPKGDLARRKSPSTAGKPLVGETRALATTVAYAVRGHVIEVGSPMVYAGVHQFGARAGSLWKGKDRRGRSARAPWGDIPARPFLGLSDADEEHILELVREYLQK